MARRWVDVLRVALAVAAAVAIAAPARAGKTPGGYTVVVSEATCARADWRKVADALAARHGADVCRYKSSVTEALAPLKKRMCRYACFVATPAEAGRQFVADVHQLTRKLDDDPYTDVRWGILTGYDAAGALRIARHAEPLVVRRVASGTDVALEMCTEGVWYCELTAGRIVRKRPGGKPVEEKGPADSTKALVDTLNVYQADLFVTSGHATERDWQIGFRYRNGSFRCKDGQLYGLDTQRRRFDVKSPNPKVYMPVGNCLMGHINSPEAMAPAWMNSAGVMQMIGYTVPTWFGYAGWGMLDYFVEQPGRYTFNEAFLANNHALVHRLTTEFAGRAADRSSRGPARGLLFDRDVVAFYGDPAWVAGLAPGPVAWTQTLTEKDGRFTFTIEPQRGAKTFQPINTNGSQRGWRPIVAFLPHRIKDVKVLQGADLKPVITDDFILVPNPRTCEAKRTYQVVFTAAKVG